MTDLETNLDRLSGAAPWDQFPDWEQVLRLSEQMLKAAQDQEWGMLVQIEGERRGLLHTCVARPPDDPQGRATISWAIQQVLDIDRQIIVLGQMGRQVLAGKIQSLQTGQRARQAYKI
jgi:hypothetical protein